MSELRGIGEKVRYYNEATSMYEAGTIARVLLDVQTDGDVFYVVSKLDGDVELFADFELGDAPTTIEDVMSDINSTGVMNELDTLFKELVDMSDDNRQVVPVVLVAVADRPTGKVVYYQWKDDRGENEFQQAASEDIVEIMRSLGLSQAGLNTVVTPEPEATDETDLASEFPLCEDYPNCICGQLDKAEAEGTDSGELYDALMDEIEATLATMKPTTTH